MKGKLVSLFTRLGCAATIAGMTLVEAQAQDVVINELNLVTGPNVGQFISFMETRERTWTATVWCW